MAKPSETLTVGPLKLRIPGNWEALTSQREADGAFRLAEGSPDLTVYHSRAYLEFAAAHGSPSVLLVARRGGELSLGVALYARGENGFTTGYSGLLLPRDGGERTLKKGIAAFCELLPLNPHLERVECLQSSLSAGAFDPARWTTIDSALTYLGPPGAVEHLFTRVVALGPGAPTLERKSQQGELSADELDEALIKSYDGDLRNQIRQAARHGLRLRYHVLCDGAAPAPVDDAYRDYLPIHTESWTRTGMAPHDRGYWHALSRAVIGGGGVDLVVLAVADGKPLAGVTCHLFREQALYWSGGSIGEALPKRANPLCLHAALSLCRRLGARTLELGRAPAWQDEKGDSITRYKAQFGGATRRVPNLNVRPPLPKLQRLLSAVRNWRQVRA
jgi:hypothetical protein